jgi:hypothetical protein
MEENEIKETSKLKEELLLSIPKCTIWVKYF